MCSVVISVSFGMRRIVKRAQLLTPMLRACQTLDLKKNRLQDCPEEIGALSRLRRLELDGERMLPVNLPAFQDTV